MKQKWKIPSEAEYERQLQRKYIQLQKQCPLSKTATYEQYINWFVKRYNVYYQDYYVAFCKLLKDIGFPQTTCKIREDIEDKLRQQRKRSFNDILLMDPVVRMREIDGLAGKQFEELLKWFFTNQGYIVQKTKPGHDQGADLILIHRNGNTAIQAKRRKRTLGNKAVQEIYAAQKYYNCTRAMVITSSYFTKSAITLAQSCNVELIDRDRLNEMINRAIF